MIKYKLLKNGSIEKSGHKHTFTAKEVKESLTNLAKLKKEMTAQKKLEDAKTQNIQHFNEFTQTMTFEQLHAAHLCYMAVNNSKLCEEKLKEIDEAEVETKEAIEQIKIQTGVKI